MNDIPSLDVVCLTGELDISRRGESRDALRQNNDANAILVDLSKVTYADSTALTELLRFCLTATNENIPVAVLAGNRQFARLVQYAGLADALVVFNDRAQALAYLSEAARR
jgi:anti-anti-sigma factor